MDMKLIRSSAPPIRSGTNTQKQNIQRQNSKSFAEVLKAQKEKTEVKLSAHAQKRLRENNINISSQDITKISDAAAKAEKKGSRESLMLLRDLALVVNISNRTIITAVDRARQKDKIFTNIDSTIIL